MKKEPTLPKHIDRISCEFSTTLNLGGDEWPIFLQDKSKTHKIILSPWRYAYIQRQSFKTLEK